MNHINSNSSLLFQLATEVGEGALKFDSLWNRTTEAVISIELNGYKGGGVKGSKYPQVSLSRQILRKSGRPKKLIQ